MKQILLVCGASLLSATALAQELGTVISSTPVMQQVVVPRLVCQNQQVAVAPQPSGAGAVIGAIAGGVIGSAFGGGSGQAAATAFGALGGAVLGNQVEARQPGQVQTVQNCSTQNFYQNQAAYYDVEYEYAGRRYRVQMPHDPGRTVPVQVTPVASLPPVQAPARIVTAPSYAQPALEHVTVLPAPPVYRAEPAYGAPAYVAPSYAPPSYVAPLAIGLSLGFIGGHLSHRQYAPTPRYYHRPPPGWRHRH